MTVFDGMPVMTRRGVIAAAAALAALPSAALADAVSQATGLVTAIAGELTKMVRSGRSVSQVTKDFERVLAKYGDMPAVAAASLGQPWRSASNSQNQAYVAAFQRYLATKYGRQFHEYKNASMGVTGARDAGKKGVLVNTVVKRPGQESIKVDWQISARSGSPKAVNMWIEGVSMLANERAEIGAMLDAGRGSIDALIAELRKRA